MTTQQQITDDTTQLDNVYTIADFAIPTLLEQINALNKRARRLKVPEIVVNVEHSHIVHIWKHGDGKTFWVHESKQEKYTQAATNKYATQRDTGRTIAFSSVEVIGTAPKFAGYRFVATLEPTEQVDAEDRTSWVNMIKSVPGHEESLPAEYRDKVFQCDHCKKQRRRKETFVVQHEDGHYMMVGRQCLKDFLGHKDPGSLARWAAILSELGDACRVCSDPEEYFETYGRRVPPSWAPDAFMLTAVCVIREKGWLPVSACKYDDTPSTRERIMYLLDPPPFVGRDAGKLRREHGEFCQQCAPRDKDIEQASAALAWARGLSDSEVEANDYLYNVRTAARSPNVTRKQAGIVASIPAAYARAQETEIKRAELKRKAALSKHVGEVKVRFETVVDCERVISIDGHYGVTGLHIMRDEDGNELKWFASQSADWMEPGSKYRIKTTVKAHDEYNGTAQTLVSRTKILEEIEK